MTSIIPATDRFLNLSGTCRQCGSTAYTVRELTLHPGQQFRCYSCFDRARNPKWLCVDQIVGLEREGMRP